ncbi:hypothetical protein GCM10010231_29380 [Streptomyces sindenensis]|nr:hypothetical protein GCM10010231_29380 [Streptomyces sindenensis]
MYAALLAEPVRLSATAALPGSPSGLRNPGERQGPGAPWRSVLEERENSAEVTA